MEPEVIQDQAEVAEPVEGAPPEARPAATMPTDSSKLEKLRDYSKRIVSARFAFTEADAARKRAKAALEAEQECLESYLRRMDDPQSELPFMAEGTSAEAADGDDSQAWRSNPIESLCDFGLAPGIANKLIAEDIKTFGALVDFTSGDGEKSKQIEDIKGIGAKAADAIREALSGYWEHWAKAQAADLDREVASAVERLEEGRKAKATNRKAG